MLIVLHMNKVTKIISAPCFVFIVAIVLIPLTLFEAHAIEPWPVEPLIGKAAPDFTLEDLKGSTVSLSLLRGKPVLLNFWATWCPYCRKERPHLEDLHARYKNKNLVIVSISIDRSVDRLRSFMDGSPTQFVTLHDERGLVSSLYNVAGLPTSYLIDRQGIIKKKFTGFREWGSAGSIKIIDAFIND